MCLSNRDRNASFFLFRVCVCMCVLHTWVYLHRACGKGQFAQWHPLCSVFIVRPVTVGFEQFPLHIDIFFLGRWRSFLSTGSISGQQVLLHWLTESYLSSLSQMMRLSTRYVILKKTKKWQCVTEMATPFCTWEIWGISLCEVSWYPMCLFSLDQRPLFSSAPVRKSCLLGIQQSLRTRRFPPDLCRVTRFPSRAQKWFQ